MPVDPLENSPATAAPRTWWVYMVRAENGHLYTGISTDPLRRFAQHQRGKGARFFNRSPAQSLEWSERCSDHSDALRRELSIKAMSKVAKERLISQFNGPSSTPASGWAVSPAPAKLTPP